MKPPAAAPVPLLLDICDDDEEEFDEAIELSAERAGEMARGLTEVAQEFPQIVCPSLLALSRHTNGILVESEMGVRWIIRHDAPEYLALISALIRPELLCVYTAGSC